MPVWIPTYLGGQVLLEDSGEKLSAKKPQGKMHWFPQLWFQQETAKRTLYNSLVQNSVLCGLLELLPDVPGRLRHRSKRLWP